jgi:Domain of unknown function (DUF1707)/FHA domain
MGGSAADTPATPGFLRASDAERDHAIDKLRQEFVDGRLSHETFMFRMQSALGARNRAQLAGLFIDLPPRRGRPLNPSQLIARVRAAFRRRDEGVTDAAPDRHQGSPVAGGFQGRPTGIRAPHDVPGVSVSLAGIPAPGAPGGQGPAVPAPLFFPPGSGLSFTIGRTQDCDLRIADMSVSRLHAQLDRVEDGWLLSDLGSHNGTRVNGWLVREAVPVRAGDLVQFGSTTFVVQTPQRVPGAGQPSPRGVWGDGSPQIEGGSGGMGPPAGQGGSGGMGPPAGQGGSGGMGPPRGNSGAKGVPAG